MCFSQALVGHLVLNSAPTVHSDPETRQVLPFGLPVRAGCPLAFWKLAEQLPSPVTENQLGSPSQRKPNL